MVRFVFGLLLGLGGGYLLGTRGEIISTLKGQRASRSELDSLSRDELYERAQAEDLAGRSSMNKEELARRARPRPQDDGRGDRYRHQESWRGSRRRAHGSERLLASWRVSGTAPKLAEHASFGDSGGRLFRRIRSQSRTCPHVRTARRTKTSEAEVASQAVGDSMPANRARTPPVSGSHVPVPSPTSGRDPFTDPSVECAQLICSKTPLISNARLTIAGVSSRRRNDVPRSRASSFVLRSV